MSVVEGQDVTFKVEILGDPQAKLKWLHDGEEVVEDYSTEIAEDGSLTMPSAELKHSGVYQLVAVTWAGRLEKEVKLLVWKDGEPSPEDGKDLCFSPVRLEQFGECVAKGHASSNEIFKCQYSVSVISMYGAQQQHSLFTGVRQGC